MSDRFTMVEETLREIITHQMNLMLFLVKCGENYIVETINYFQMKVL